MTSGAAATELSALTEAIDGLELSVDRETIVGALAQRDRLDARIAAAVAAFDAAELWDCDGATSMTRWLVNEGRLGDGAARRLVRTAGRLAQWPVLARAFAEGTVSAGQVEHVAQRVRPHHVELFAEHEAALVPALALLDLDATITVVREWSDKADALIDTEPAEPKASTLHVNQVGDRGRLDSDLTGQPTTAAVRAWYRSGLDHLTGDQGAAATTLSGHDLSPALAAA